MLTAREGVVYLEKPEALSGSPAEQARGFRVRHRLEHGAVALAAQERAQRMAGMGLVERKQTEPPVLPELLLVPSRMQL